jgi:hypothetical protein
MYAGKTVRDPDATLAAREARDSMEEADVREQNTNATRWALGAAAAALTLAIALALAGGPARAQDPGCDNDPTYCIPTPTPTATPAGTPFQNPNPPPPEQPETGPKLMSPFPVVRTAGSYTRTRTTFTRFTVKAAAGTKVATSCVKATCRLRRTLKSRKTVHLRPLERTFKAGRRIRVRVSAPGVIGKYVEIRTRRGKRPLRADRCLRPGSTKPASCGAG